MAKHDVLPIRDSTKGPRGSCTFSDGKTHLGKDRISLCLLDRSDWMMEPSQPKNETSILDLPPSVLRKTHQPEREGSALEG
jgi:hypothetical protein